MIRFIDLGEQICEGVREFAFYNTINDQFINCDGIETFDSWEVFQTLYKGDELERFKSLCQLWVFEKKGGE